MTTRVERSFRGISERLAIHYLTTLGGDRVGEDADAVAGDGWEARLSTERVDVGPSLSLTEVTVTVEGDEDAVSALIEDFARKAMRAGG